MFYEHLYKLITYKNFRLALPFDKNTNFQYSGILIQCFSIPSMIMVSMVDIDLFLIGFFYRLGGVKHVK